MEYTKGATSVDYGYDSEGQRVSKTVNGVKYDYYYVGGKLMVEHCPSYTLFYSYDANGNLYAIKKQFSNSSYEYYYAVCNSRGDVLALYNEGGNLECKYHYDSWGKLISVADHNGNSITAKNHIAIQNSIRYRGYVYDTETGLYYLNSRYYDPETCRFINADNQIALGYDLSGVNLYAYCGSNPISRIDPTGEKWWHWAIGAAIIGACAVATVVTAGGFVAAAGAVAAVGSGVAAATTASTVAAGAFIGSATVYGIAVVSAASTSSTPQDFADKGNWGTVAATAGGAVIGGGSAYISTKESSSALNINHSISRGSTGRTQPLNLREQLAMEQVKSNPFAGTPLSKVPMNDSRWPASEGWIKMQQIVPTSQGNINIHYVYNQALKIFDDFKFNS